MRAVDEGRSSSSSSGGEAKFKGVRKRKWGKWVSEVRLPNSRERIWLGSYDSPEKAARAFDAAAYSLRGRKARLNFPHYPPQVPPARSLTHHQIQQAAQRHAHSVPEPPATALPNTTAEANSPSEASEEAPAPAVATTDWSFLDLMSDGFPVIDELYYDFISAAHPGPAADMAAPAEESGNGFGTNSSLWSF